MLLAVLPKDKLSLARGEEEKMFLLLCLLWGKDISLFLFMVNRSFRRPLFFCLSKRSQFFTATAYFGQFGRDFQRRNYFFQLCFKFYSLNNRGWQLELLSKSFLGRRVKGPDIYLKACLFCGYVNLYCCV